MFVTKLLGWSEYLSIYLASPPLATNQPFPIIFAVVLCCTHFKQSIPCIFSTTMVSIVDLSQGANHADSFLGSLVCGLLSGTKSIQLVSYFFVSVMLCCLSWAWGPHSTRRISAGVAS